MIQSSLYILLKLINKDFLCSSTTISIMTVLVTSIFCIFKKSQHYYFPILPPIFEKTKNNRTVCFRVLLQISSWKSWHLEHIVQVLWKKISDNFFFVLYFDVPCFLWFGPSTLHFCACLAVVLGEQNNLATHYHELIWCYPLKMHFGKSLSLLFIHFLALWVS